MEQYREYESDEAKLKHYDHRLYQANEAFDREKFLLKSWVERYENKPNPNSFSGNGHNVSVPTGTSIIDSLYSSLTATDVEAMVSAIGKGTHDQEALATAALAKEWELTKTPRRAARAIKDSLLIGIGWVKVGYEYYESEEEVPRTDAAIAEDIDRFVREAQDAEHDITAEEIATYVPVTEVRKFVLSERIVVDYVPWDMVRWDPTAKSVEDIRWIAQLTYMHPEDVKEHPAFKAYCARNKTAKKLKDLGGDVVLELANAENQNMPDERVTVVQMYDFETGTVCTFAKGADFLLDEAPNLFQLNDDLEDKSPFVPLVMRTSPGRVRGVSEMELLMPTLQELDLYHSKLATYLERMTPKVIGPRRAMTDSGREAMESQEYGAYVELDEGFTASDITDFRPPTLPSEVYGVPDKLEDAAREATGVNELMRGLFPDRKRTATETSEVVASSAARQAEKRVNLERFYEAIGRRILQLMQMFYTQDRMVRYADWDGPVEWTWTADDIVMESKLEIVLTPKEARDWKAKRDDALAMLNVLGPLAQPGPAGSSPIDLVELLRFVLTNLGMKRSDIVAVLNLPEEQQMQQMAAQQQAAGMMASEQMGVPRPDMVPGPMNPEQLALATNAGELPPEIVAAAMGNIPGSPGAAEQVSENVGPTLPPGM